MSQEVVRSQVKADSPADEPALPAKAADHKSDASVRTAIVTGSFGIAGTLLTCLVTWSLNRIDRTPAPPVTANIVVPAAAVATPAAATPPIVVGPVVVAESPLAAPPPPAHEELLRQSPISFADFQAMVREKYTYEQRKVIFGSDVGKRVTWLGVFDQFNLITLSTATRDDAYILVLFESEADRTRPSVLRAPAALCHFPAVAKRQLDQLRPGQRLVISGTLANPEFTGQYLGTELQACELVAVLDK